MLSRLSIRNFVLIDQLDLDFKHGLTVLTGETGAGKSILLDAIGLLLGERSDAGMIRTGTSEAIITAAFDLTLAAKNFSPEQLEGLAEYGWNPDDGELLLARRTINRDGRAKGFIGDMPATVTALKRILSPLVEIHGQFQTYSLLAGDSYRKILDSFGGHSSALALVEQNWKHWAAAKADLQTAEARQQTITERWEFLKHSIAELENLSPKPNEEAELLLERNRLQNRDRIAGSIREVMSHLDGYDAKAGNIITKLYACARAVDALSGLDMPEMQHITERLNSMVLEAEDIRATLQSTAHSFSEPAKTMDTVDDRLLLLRQLSRKHKVDSTDLAVLLPKLQSELADLNDIAAIIKAKRAECEQAKAAYMNAAKVLSAARITAANALQNRLLQELPPLKLDKARLDIPITFGDESTANAHGMDSIDFLVAMNPGSPLAPLHKVASGGELARMMLALKVCMTAGNQNTESGSDSSASLNQPAILIFDEIDTGAGGAVAHAIGKRLARLADAPEGGGISLQVLAVTHSPQVAACATTHLKVEKAVHGTGESQMTTTRVYKLTENDSAAELARMLSGAEITSEALAAAHKLKAAS